MALVTVTDGGSEPQPDTGMELSRSDISQALHRVLASSEFSEADRLKAFLTYVVQEHLEGRSQRILGKTILEDVYNKTPGASDSSESVVRVDASRLRRRLDLYYASEGASDAVRIHVDKGGYVPRFERLRPTAETTASPRIRPFTGGFARLVVGGAGLGLVLAALFVAFRQDRALNVQDELTPAGRSALFEEAPASLLARNMASEARDLLFPATQLIRVTSAREMFEEVTRLAPDYYGGHAGQSQAAAILAGLSPDPDDRKQQLELAMTAAERAVALDPTKAWSQSAAAFAAFVARDYEMANLLSQKALDLEPGNRHAMEIDAIIALFSGDFERAISSADPDIHQGRRGFGFPWRNALGNAYFHSGDYMQSIRYLTEAVTAGEPVSEINTAHLIASYAASGNLTKARDLVGAFNVSWPDSRLDAMLNRIFQYSSDAENVLEQMAKAGWVRPSAKQEP